MTSFFPTTDPVLIVAIATMLFLIAPLLAERLRLPGLIGLILAGAVVGPNGLELLARDATIELLGTVGLVYLMFLAGLELDLTGFQRYRNRSLAFGAISFALPFALAIGTMGFLGFSMPAAVLIGAVVASHTLLAYPIASRLGITKDPAVTSVMGGTLLTDSLSLAVLAVVDAVASGAQGVAFWLRLAGSLGLYLGLAMWLIPRLGRWFFRSAEGESTTRFFFLMAALFVSAYSADIAGAQPIIGAFLAGLLLNRLIPDQSPLMTRVRFFGNAFFIPFFLFSVGMLFDFGALFEGTRVLIVAGALIALVLVGKGLSALLSGRMLGFTNDQGWLMAGLSIPQAAATLAVTFVGLEIGLFDEAVVSAVIVLIVVSSLIVASVAARMCQRIATAAEVAPYVQDTAPHRILVPLANPTTAEALMDVAFLVREPRSSEPLYPLTVVSDDAEASSRVARAERMLAHAVVYAAEADVPTNPVTRVAQNPAVGIARAVTERRITDIIIGWAGRTSAIPQVIFGNVIDQTLHLTEPQIMVCKLDRPLSTHQRLIVVLPALIDYSPGFYQASHTLKLIAAGLGTKLEVWTVMQASRNMAAQRLAQRFTAVEPELEATNSSFDGWTALRTELRERLTENDLVAIISARTGTVAHTQQLERMPTELSKLEASFVIVYPSERPVGDQPRHDLHELPPLLAEDRVLFDLDAEDHRSAVHRLLETTIDSEQKRETLAKVLLETDTGDAAEILPGILLFHARAKAVREPMLFLGIQPEGITHPLSKRAVNVVCILLSPADTSTQKHLAMLAEVVEQLVGGGEPETLAACASMEELRAWFAGDDG
jgi:Kef-type K+ transport system membrane component KefB/mannitol/fructose-specific phosphotransferase system IIA component (Ntr-type)